MTLQRHDGPAARNTNRRDKVNTKNTKTETTDTTKPVKHFLRHVCGTPVVRYPNGESFPTFYCPKCQTGDWPN